MSRGGCEDISSVEGRTHHLGLQIGVGQLMDSRSPLSQDVTEQTIVGSHPSVPAVIDGDTTAFAADAGIEIVLENIEDGNPADRKALVESFASDALKLSIDTGHAHYAHGICNAPPVDYYVKSAGNLLAHVHLQDADAHADRHWSIGRGSIHWHAVFDALAKLDAYPRLILELKNRAEIPASMAWLEAEGLGVTKIRMAK